MKKITFIAILHAFCFTVLAQQSTLVLIRPDNHFASSQRAKVFVKDSVVKPLCLYNNSYAIQKLKGDTIQLYEASSSRKPLVVAPTPGATVYGLVTVWPGFWSVQTELNLIDSQKAQGYLLNPKILDLRKPLTRPMMRVGIELGAGFGLNDFAIIQTTEGDESKLGYGGGIMYGLMVGNQFTNHFDLELSYRYADRGLTPHLENASIHFTRHLVNITPSFVIPIQGGYYQRVRVGGGLTMAFDAKQKWNTSELQTGFKDTWIYDNAVGYHATLVYELNFAKNFSSYMGLRYTDITYAFKQSAIAVPVIDKLTNPRGNSIDLLIGFSYHF
ncbi:MAG: hypothetical protein MUE96_02735 [Bacteroidia bacterium]|jgi:hypothetical protein|nr:hypothetical protein [Bacteroidia bacterium]